MWCPTAKIGNVQLGLGVGPLARDQLLMDFLANEAEGELVAVQDFTVGVLDEIDNPKRLAGLILGRGDLTGNPALEINLLAES